MNDKIKLGLSHTDKGILIVIPPVLGGIIGWYAPIIAGWLVKLPFLPYGRVFEWIASLSNPWVTTITLGIGVIVGIIFTIYAFAESLKIEVNDQQIKTTIKNQQQLFSKRDLSAIFLDKKQLVFLGINGEELFREEKPEMKKETIQHAYDSYGYPWKEQDPFINKYFLWVEQHPELDVHTNTLLAARETAIEENKNKKAVDIRKELANNGIVIWDDGEKQYIRKVQSEA